jgi:hypothetical protein
MCRVDYNSAEHVEMRPHRCLVRRNAKVQLGKPGVWQASSQVVNEDQGRGPSRVQVSCIRSTKNQGQARS